MWMSARWTSPANRCALTALEATTVAVDEAMKSTLMSPRHAKVSVVFHQLKLGGHTAIGPKVNLGKT